MNNSLHIPMRYPSLLILSLVLAVFLSACTLPLPPPVCREYQVYTIGEDCNQNRVRAERYFKERLACAQMNDANAQYEVARLFMMGIGVCVDPAQSVHWFEQAANNGVQDAIVQMGNFYRDGYIVQKNVQCAIRWYEKAANCGNITAMLALGDLYIRCVDVKPDYKKAYCWYRKAADLGAVDGELKLAWVKARSGNKQSQCEALETLTALAETGEPRALTQIGDMYAEGRINCPNWTQAYNYYQEAARVGSGEAAFKIGMMYEVGQGIKQDHRKAAEWITVSAERGFPVAEMYLADMYRDGWVLPRSYNLAALWYTRAVANGMAAAEVELGDLYHAGKGVKQRNLEDAFRWYLLSAQHTNDAYAQLMLSVMYKEGRGVCHNMEESVCWYNKAKKSKDFAKAERCIAKRYAAGYGLRRDIQEAVRWYYLAANHGNVDAQLDLADLYYTGEWSDFELVNCSPCCDREKIIVDDICQNYEKAYQLYLLAAKNGSTYGENMVGTMLLEGKGVCANPLQATIWFRKAAYKCAKQAQYQLGKMYLDGCGVPQSYVHAYAWLKIALTDQMDKTPEIIMKNLDRMMPPEREEAVKLAKRYEQNYSCCPVRILPVRQPRSEKAACWKDISKSPVMREYSSK